MQHGEDMDVELMNRGRKGPRGNGPQVRFGGPFDGPPSEIDEEEEQPTRRMVPNAAPDAVADYLSQYKMPIRTPLHVKVNFVPILLLLFYVTSAAFYFYVRITKTLVDGPMFAYGIVVLVVEFLGMSSTLPYALLLIISLVPKGNATGLPPEEEGLHSTERFNFHVRVLVPCYKEDISVIRATILGALNADLPIGAKRTVYLCDDGNQDVKKTFVEGLVAEGREIEYISGRKKIPKDTNGKSSNLNNCLMNHIYAQYRYPGTKEINWERIPETEIIVVFDADMVAKKQFFLRILEPLTNPQYALCLSPQAFHNINPAADLFNNINLQFWEYWLPGAVAWGYIACTGTNFAIRARPLAHCNFFPTYTITEDYALGYELKKKGYKGSYLLDYIAEGEAPDEVRNVMRQRSRWCKGHMQVFFSWKYSPLTQWKLSLPMKFWYSYGTWSYIVNVIATPVSLLIPFLSLGFGLNPVVINYWFAAGATCYYLAIFLVQTYFHQLAHIKSLWFANISNTVLWFTYTKAIMNVLLSKFGLKGGVGFKVTEKKVAEPALAMPLARVRSGLSRVLSRVSSRRGWDAPSNVTYESVEKADAPTPGAPTPKSVHDFPPEGSTPGSTPGAHTPQPHSRAPPPPYSPLHSESSGVSVLGGPTVGGPVNLTVVVNNPREQDPLLSDGRPAAPHRPAWYKRVGSVFRARNLVDMGGVLDPTALYIMLAFCLAVVGMGIWRTATTPGGGRGARYIGFSPYVGLPMFWAIYNSIAPFLFVVYTFTSGKGFRKAAAWGQFLGTLTLLGAMILLWATVPVDFNMPDATAKAGRFMTQVVENAKSFQDLAAIGNDITNPKDVTGGWLIGSDPVKYGMPLATSASLLAWSMLEFPGGYRQAGTFDESLQNVIAAGNYLLKNLDTSNPANTIFIAQVGNPETYLLAGDPVSRGSVWTSLQQDANLGRPREAFVLNSTHAGVDLLAESAAALALGSVLVRNSGDRQLADSFVTGAVALFNLAKSTPGRERSYCDFIPCETTVTQAKVVPVVPLPAAANLDPPELKCWVPDFPLSTCSFLKDEQLCLNAAQTAPVYTRRSSCCSFMRSAGVWQNQTTPQGACALPEGQFECFIPQLQTRDCITGNISLADGKGCTGLGQEFFPTTQSCCNQLTKSQAITAAAPGRGVCALGPASCYVPDTVSRTCRQLSSASGMQCAAFGAKDQFDSPLTCCNSLVASGAISGDNPGRGLCADTVLSSCWIADLAGKRCIQLPSTLPGFADANCTSFGAKTRFDDKASCCNGLFVQVGGVGPFFDPSCAPPPTPPPNTLAPTLVPTLVPKVVPTVAPVLPGGRRLLQTAEVSPFLNLPQNVLAQQEERLVNTTVPVEFYPSHTVLDDLAWAGVALFLATKQEVYLGDAQYYMTQHLTREATGKQLNTEAGYYVFNYDTAVWAAAVELAKITDLPQYHDLVRTFLRTWVELKPPKIPLDVIASKQLASQAVKNQNMIRENIQTFDNQTYLVFDGCIPDRNNTKAAKLVAAQLAIKNEPLGATGPVQLVDPFAVTFEENCNDGRDNDCDGLTDLEDPDCPFLPVQSTDLTLAWTKDAPLPNAAAASFLTLAYSRSNRTTSEQRRRLQCWALAQVRYMMGDNFAYPDGWSYVVGFGKKNYHRATRIPDRQSSCPKDPTQPCDIFNAYFPGLPNPQLGLVTGALVAGPNFDDTFWDDRRSNNTRVGSDFQTPFMAAMAGILDLGVDVKTCGQLNGVYNDVFGKVAL